MSQHNLERIYETLIRQHINESRQMIFLGGPRQVGKTTLSLLIKEINPDFYYLNWDNVEHQHAVIRGPRHVFQYLGLQILTTTTPLIVFDEIHKFSRWKQFLKGFFDTYGKQVKIIVTGSAKLDIYKRIGDSLMGRYFQYRIHPLSVAELLTPNLIDTEIRTPKKIVPHQFDQLFEYGGFPEPFLHENQRFQNKWLRTRYQQTFHEDIRSLIEIQEMAQLEMLATLLKSRTGQLINYSDLAQEVNVSVPTIKRWINSLSEFYYCFIVKPWHKNVSSALKKQPKVYLWDWSDIHDQGARIENFIASHLLKAVNFWTDYGFGNYDLYYIRDKRKREVDFVVTKNQQPWFLVEVKQSNNGGINPALYAFQEQIKAKHAFQVVFDMPYINQDCFKHTKPVIVPAQTLLSQLM